MNLNWFFLSILFSSCVAISFAMSNTQVAVNSIHQEAPSQKLMLRNKAASHLNPTSETSILEFLKNQRRQFYPGIQKDFVLLLGNTGSGKSTLALLLSGADLEAVEIVENSGVFLIVDENGRIGRNSTITSKTIVPELKIDATTGTAYFDCPGFSDTRSVTHDISSAYFVKKLLNFANSVKLVFLVNYSSVRSGGDRFDFMVLAKHATSLIKNIEKYRNGIALVVTKVETYRFFDDSRVIETIAWFLRQAKDELKIKNLGNISQEDRQFHNNVIKFIEILLEKRENRYERISIFRFVQQSGPVRDMPLIQTEKQTIETMINQNMQFIPNESDDFSYTISADSKNRVHELIDEMHIHLTAAVSSISREIEQFYVQQEKQYSDVNLLKEKMMSGLQKLTEVEATEPRMFLIQLIRAAKILGIGISMDSVSNYIEFIEFLKSVTDSTLSNSFQILANELSHCTEYLYYSNKWYSFLIDFHELLSGYDVQKNATGYHDSASRLITQCFIEENKEINVTDIGLSQFLNQIDRRIYRDVENMQVNSFKMKALKDILEFSLQEATTSIAPTCIDNKLTVKGHNVKISEVIKINCWHQAKFIEVFALNKLFVDADIDRTGEKMQLTIISPIWEVVGDRQIVLSGENGGRHKNLNARDGIGPQSSGEDGKPGKPGGSAGNFLGIGHTFINDNLLKIYANGGGGGEGQNGGRAGSNSNGENPPIPELTFTPEDEWKLKNFTFSEKNTDKWYSWTNIAFMEKKTYKVYGKNATKGGSGGNGGAGGEGGYAGKILIAGLGRTPNSSLFHEKGNSGAVGIGMRGGIEMDHGKVIEVSYMTFEPVSMETGGTIRLPYIDILSTKSGGKTEAGKNGTDGYNRVGINRPDITDFLNPSHTINSYKNYVREHLSDNIRESHLRNFMKDLEEDMRIQRLYDNLGLVNELQGLEYQYFQLRNKLSFAPFLQSLIHRIRKTEVKSVEDKKVLSFLYTAALSKVCGIGSKANLNLFVDLPKYLDLVRKSIDKLNRISTDVSINEHRNEYKESLHRKIESANYFIETQIQPEIDKVFERIDEQIHKLIDEVIAIQDLTRAEIEKKKKKQKDLEKSLLLRKALFPLKIVGIFLGFLGPVGTGVGAVLGGTTMISESLFLDDTSDQGNDKLSSLSTAFKTSVSKIGDQFKNEHQLFKDQLNHIENDLNVFTKTDASTDLQGIQRKVTELKSQINEQMKSSATLDPAATDQMRGELKAILTDQKTILEQRKPLLDIKVERKLRIVNNVLTVVSLAEVSIDAYNRIRNDEAKIRIASEAVQTLGNQLTSLKTREQDIYKVMVPRLREIENTANELSKQLNGTMHVELDIRKWNIQSALRDVKILFHQMTINFTMQEDLQRCIEKLEEAMSTLIDVYDRIDSYSDSAKLAAYISDIGSRNAKSLILSGPRNDAIMSLNQIIQSNLVLEQFEAGMHSFKQHFFPFGHLYLMKYQLPENLQLNNTDTLISNAIDKIDDLKAQVENSLISIEKYDRYIFSDIEFNSNIKESTPFYVWESYEIKNEIEKLFQGEEITIKADITKGVNKNAVKFNEIGINFKLANERAQNELDAELEGFRVIMTLVGNNYYRCFNRYYYISIDHDIVIDYSFKKGVDGKPFQRNKIYKKISKNDYFLSPYAIWSIRLINANDNFVRLGRFNSIAIDLELVGRGQYLDQQPFEAEICNDKLDEFYNYDETISDADNIEFSNNLSLL